MIFRKSMHWPKPNSPPESSPSSFKLTRESERFCFVVFEETSKYSENPTCVAFVELIQSRKKGIPQLLSSFKHHTLQMNSDCDQKSKAETHLDVHLTQTREYPNCMGSFV